jgi:hypothetical protein
MIYNYRAFLLELVQHEGILVHNNTPVHTVYTIRDLFEEVGV